MTKTGDGATEIRGYASIILANLLFAIAFCFVSAIGGALSVWQLVLLRGVLFLLWLLPWALRHPQTARGVNHKLLLLRGGLGSAMYLCLVYALTVLPVSIATLLAKTTPLWELLVLWALLALRPRIVEILLAPIALMGLALVLHPEGHLSIFALSHLGLGLALLAGMLNSLEFLTLSRVRRTDAAQTVNLWYASISIAVTLPFAMLAPWPDDPRIWLFALLFASCSFAGQSLLAQSMHSVPPSVAGVATLLVPIFATLIGWAVLGQLISGLELVGIALVLIPGALVARFGAAQKAAFTAAAFRWQR